MPALTLSTAANASDRRSSISHDDQDRDTSDTSSHRSSHSPQSQSSRLSTLPGVGHQGSRNANPQRPFPVPISESENPDAIALRSAISILQMQREQSKADLQSLETLKQRAVSRPEEFRLQLAAGRLMEGPGSRRMLGTDVGNVTGRQHTGPRREDHDDDDDHMSTSHSDSDEERPVQRQPPKIGSPFGVLPTPQNVVRCPPINWSKYHVVGESLDKLHEEQRSRPSEGEPRHDDAAQPPSQARMPEAVIAAPYRPSIDSHVEPVKTRRGAKR
ncbi:MAG: hypothetical protein M1833_001583 [Piccolia ochrophora]|nr:MAG: hypothetical protein M1833_001583 [Piccolia ochrophora]